MAIGRRTGGAPRWFQICAGSVAAALLLALTFIYLLTTAHVRSALSRFSRGDAPPRSVHGIPYADLINRAASAHDVNPAVVAAVVAAESGFNAHARSRRGAYGLMQVLPATWREVGVTPSCAPQTAALTTPPCMDDPAANLDVGAAYLGRLIRRFNGNLLLALAAYNAGAETVEQHGGVPPFPETARYLRQVALAWFHLQQDGTLTPFWRGVLRSFDVWQRARAALIGGLLTLALPLLWAVPRRAGAIRW
ncbi:MAG TPA: lytic transglycosylase domain-containing protein [bacterium]|nr:lytic transglycosylase domain-containing protein [bacterium]